MHLAVALMSASARGAGGGSFRQACAITLVYRVKEQAIVQLPAWCIDPIGLHML